MSKKPKEKLSSDLQFFLANLLILPGLGSVLQGKKSGYIQMGLSLLGLIFSGLFLLYLLRIFHQGELQEKLRLWAGPGGLHEWLTDPYCRLGWLGVFLFFTSWLWSMVVSRPKNEKEEAV